MPRSRRTTRGPAPPAGQPASPPTAYPGTSTSPLATDQQASRSESCQSKQRCARPGPPPPTGQQHHEAPELCVVDSTVLVAVQHRNHPLRLSRRHAQPQRCGGRVRSGKASAGKAGRAGARATSGGVPAAESGTAWRRSVAAQRGGTAAGGMRCSEVGRRAACWRTGGRPVHLPRIQLPVAVAVDVPVHRPDTLLLGQNVAAGGRGRARLRKGTGRRRKSELKRLVGTENLLAHLLNSENWTSRFLSLSYWVSRSEM